MSHPDDYAKARGRAEAKYSLTVHAVVYAAVMLLLVVINLTTSPDVLWFIWPLMGWGLALALHAIGVFFLSSRQAAIDTMTERELRKAGGQSADKTGTHKSA